MRVSDSYQLSHACINKTNTKWKIVLKRSLDPSGAAQIPTMHFTILHCLTFPSESMELTLQTVEATNHELNLVSTYFLGCQNIISNVMPDYHGFIIIPPRQQNSSSCFLGGPKKQDVRVYFLSF